MITKEMKDVKKFLKFINPDQLIEVSIINPAKTTSSLWDGEAREKGVITGYFNDHKQVINFLDKLNELEADGVYVTLNPVIEKCLSRAANKFKPNINRTKDEEIASLRNLLIDIDPVGPTRTPASKDQKKKAWMTTRKIRKNLKKLGFPKSLTDDSGNGYHLIYKIKKDNTEENTKLINTFLISLAKKYGSPEVKIDTSVGNPSRLVRLPGTFNRKGKDTPETPHRLAKIKTIPDKPKLLTFRKLKKFIKRTGESQEKEEASDRSLGTGILDVESYLDNYGIAIHKIKEDYRGGTMYCLKECVFDKTHTPNESSIIQGPDGKLFYQCFHDSCQQHRWEDARKVISGADKLTKYLSGDPSHPPEKYPKLTVISASEMIKTDWPSEPPVIDGLLEETGCLILAGAGGIGKSMLTLNIALNLGSPPRDKQLWGLFKILRRVNTLIIQSENTNVYQKSRLELMVKSNPAFKNAIPHIFFPQSNQDCRIYGDLKDDGFIDEIREMIYRTEAGLLILDPLISYHCKNENDNMEMRNVLERITFKLIETTKVAVILAHHPAKGVDGLRGAGSIRDWATGILILSQDKKEEDLIDVTHDKSRNFMKVPPFSLRMTPGFQFERVLSENDEEEDLTDVTEALESLGGRVGNQKTLIEAVKERMGQSDATARRAIEKAEKAALIEKVPGGKGKGYRLVTSESGDDSEE